MDRTVSCSSCGAPVAQSAAWVCVDCASFVHPACCRDGSARKLPSGQSASRCTSCEQSPKRMHMEPLVGRGRSRA